MNLSTTFTVSAVRGAGASSRAIGGRGDTKSSRSANDLRHDATKFGNAEFPTVVMALEAACVQDRRWQNDGCRGLHPDGLRWRPGRQRGLRPGPLSSTHLAGDLERTGAYRPVTKRAMMTMVRTCITPCTPTTKKKLPITRLILATSGSGRRNWMQTHKLVGSR